MKKVIAIAALAASTFAPHAYAWGDREQGALAGIVGTLILQSINQQNQQGRQPPVVYQPGPIIIAQPRDQEVAIPSANGGVYTQRPLRCSSRPVLWDQFTGRPIQYETICR